MRVQKLAGKTGVTHVWLREIVETEFARRERRIGQMNVRENIRAIVDSNREVAGLKIERELVVRERLVRDGVVVQRVCVRWIYRGRGRNGLHYSRTIRKEKTCEYRKKTIRYGPTPQILLT